MNAQPLCTVYCTAITWVLAYHSTWKWNKPSKMPQSTICRAVKPPPQNIPTPTHRTTVAANDTNGNRATKFAQVPGTEQTQLIVTLHRQQIYLSNSVVDACTVNAFKAHLDKFWQHKLVWFYSRSDGYRKPIRRSHKVTVFVYDSIY